MTHTIDSATGVNGSNTAELFEDGGMELVIAGTFEKDRPYKVYIGDHKDTTDAICYSGVPGQGNSIYSEINNKLYVYTPMLVSTGSTPYSLTVLDTVTLATQVLPDCVYVRKKQFFNKVYSLRKILPPIYKTGARIIKEENPT